MDEKNASLEDSDAAAGRGFPRGYGVGVYGAADVFSGGSWERRNIRKVIDEKKRCLRVEH